MESQTFSFTNDQDAYPSDLKDTLCKSITMKREYFLGLCSYCYMDKGSDMPLHRCSGCQLLAYCSKDCQKLDWAFHKPICKQFPLTNGRNVLSEAQKLKKDARYKHIDEMRTTALQIGNTENMDKATNDTNSKFVQGIFDWPRVCNICKEAEVDKLTDCTCHSVSYCNDGHRKADKAHKEVCYDMLVFTRSYSYLKKYGIELNLPINKNVDKEYQPLDRMSFHVSSMRDEWLDTKLSILSERLSYPLTILYAMQQSGLGTSKSKVESATSLDIHIVCSKPMLDSSIWEMLIHRLPLLDELNISFIGVNMALENHFNIDILGKLERCSDCKSRNRLITYNIYPEHYHMHFSSLDYSEPDVIAIFNISEMSQGEEDHVHAVTSYRNMTYDEDTLIILTDKENEELEKGISDINEARPVDVIMPSSLNPLRGFSLVRGTQEKPIINDRDKMAVLRRKCDEENGSVSNE